ncbi:MAG: alpha/beta hydrolase [Candidatus Binatia bacterium]
MGAAIIRIVIIALGFFFVTSLWGFYISVRPPKIVSSLTPENLQLDYERVWFKTSDGLNLSGWLIPSEKATRKNLILLHGYPADKGDILPALSFLQKDYNLFLLDFRYLGESEGKYSTAGANEVRDLLAAIQFLKTKGIEEVGVWGFSMGGAVALMSIKKAPEIKAVVSEASYASLAQMAPELFRIPVLRYPLAYLIGLWAKIFLGIDIRDVSPVKAVQNTTIPLLLIHSLTDAVIPFSHARSLQEALKDNPRAEFWFHAGPAHGELGSEYQKRLADFFQKHL